MSWWTAYLSRHTGFFFALKKQPHLWKQSLRAVLFLFALSGIEDVFEGVRNLDGRKDFVGRALQLTLLLFLHTYLYVSFTSLGT